MTYGSHGYGVGGYGGGAPGVAPAGAGSATASVTFAGSASVSFTAAVAPRGQVTFAGSASINFVQPTIAVTGVSVTFATTSSMVLVPTTYITPTPSPVTGRVPYTLIVKKIDGTVLATLTNVKFGTVQQELNGAKSFSFSLPVLDSNAPLCQPPYREVQLKRGDVVVFEGPIVRATGGPDTVEFQCQGVEWYFKKRTIGRSPQKNLIQNPSFEEGYNKWNFGYAPASVDKTHLSYSIATPGYVGGRCLAIGQSVDQHDSAASQDFFWTVPANHPEGDVFTFTAWLYVVSFNGPALQGRGLYLERYSTTEYNPDLGAPNPKSLQVSMATIDADTPKNMWIRMETSITVPYKGGEAEIINVRLYPPNGTVYWDEASLTVDERLEWVNTDQATILYDVVGHIQDPAFGKSNLYLNRSCPPSGVLRTRAYRFADHQRADDVIGEFPNLHNGVDWDIELNGSARTFTTYFPLKGTRRGDVTLQSGTNVGKFSLDIDGEESANTVIILAEGEGSDREEGYYADLTTLDGIVMEKVYNATPGSKVDTLNDQARRGVERYKKPVAIPQLVIHPSYVNGYVGNLRLGDIVPVNLSNGYVQLVGDYRIVGMTLNPSDDTLSLALNPAEMYQYL